MSTSLSKDRSSLCTFTFADGRRCRMPRQSGHPLLCCFHARREAQAQAAEEVGRDIRFFLSGDYLSAGDLSLALGRVFAATAQGQLKPKTAGTLAYLGQTLLQTIHHAENEYINAFSTDRWRRVIHTHINENSHYLFPASPAAKAPLLAQPPEQLTPQAPSQVAYPTQMAPLCSAGFAPAPFPEAPAPSRYPHQPDAAPLPVEAGLELTQSPEGLGLSDGGRPSAVRNSSKAHQKLAVSNHAAVPRNLPRPSSPRTLLSAFVKQELVVGKIHWIGVQQLKVAVSTSRPNLR